MLKPPALAETIVAKKKKTVAKAKATKSAPAPQNADKKPEAKSASAPPNLAKAFQLEMQSIPPVPASSVVTLDPDVAPHFPNSRAVNEALRALVRIVRQVKAS